MESNKNEGSTCKIEKPSNNEPRRHIGIFFPELILKHLHYMIFLVFIYYDTRDGFTFTLNSVQVHTKLTVRYGIDSDLYYETQ